MSWGRWMRGAAVAALLILSAHAATGAADEALFYGDIRASLPGAWVETVRLDQGEKAVDAPVRFPDVERVPLLRVAPKEAAKIGADGGDTVWANTPGTLSLNHGMDWSALPAGDAVRSERHIDAYQDADLGKLFAENNALSAGDALAYLTGHARRLYGEPIEFEPDKVTLYGEWKDSGGKTLIEGGVVEITARQTLAGIPVMMGAPRTYSKKKMQYPGESRFMSECGATWSMHAENEWALTCRLWEIVAVAEDDVRLCGFERVAEALRGEIAAGRLDEVYGIRFGYALYLDAAADDVFWAVPSWIVECRYDVRGAAAIDRSFDSEAVAYDQNTGYHRLIVNAMTGELADPGDTSRDRSVYVPGDKEQEAL